MEQADIFLGNGFDDFISKPVDVRHLNLVLNRLIRDKQPPEVIEAARKEADMQTQDNQDAEDQKEIFKEVFVRDALKSIEVLDAIMAKNGNYTDEDMKKYVINVHGMKSALANLENMELSAVALKLESLGRAGGKKAIAAQTPEFLVLLKKLVKELTPKEDGEDVTMTNEDKNYLYKILQEIKKASEDYNEAVAEELITELRRKQLPGDVKKLLSKISEHLLHSDFDEAADAVGEFLKYGVIPHE